MTIKLFENSIPYYSSEADTPNCMETFFVDTDKPLACVVVCAGGAYAYRADYEEDVIAQFYNSRGLHAVVVKYRVAPNRYPAGLSDVQRAIKILRANADEWKIDPDRIVVLGFSAGGHLAASSMVLGDVTVDREGADEIDKLCARPNGGILCYAVISVESEFGHVGSGQNLLGEKYEELKAQFSLEKYVTKDTPKAFIMHTSTDDCVPVKNALVFGEALNKNGVPFEMHIYPVGYHGVGLALNYPDIRNWAPLSADWIERNI